MARWHNVMENLLLHDNLHKTFENAFSDILRHDITDGGVMETSLKMKNDTYTDQTKLVEMIKSNEKLEKSNN